MKYIVTQKVTLKHIVEANSIKEAITIAEQIGEYHAIADYSHWVAKRTDNKEILTY